MNEVERLPYPPPYRAALAISNDVDDLADPRGWWEFLRFLNTDEPTAMGPGLDLETGDSFWFYSDDPKDQPASYFEGLTDRRSRFAGAIGALGRAGYLDTLHSYGHFSRHAGFTRGHAERAAAVLADEGFAPTVWVNHGGAHDFQNLWMGCGDLPENPEAAGAPAPEYHLDLTWSLGFRYAWLGELTTVPGQDRPLKPGEFFDPRSPVAPALAEQLRRAISRRLAYRQVLATYPDYNTYRNRLITPRRLRDGSVVQSFVRFGDFRRATFAHLGWLLGAPALDGLERSGGASLAFVHWARHPGCSFGDLPPAGLEGLRRLAQRARDGRIWVTTAGRLLAYCEARGAVRHRVESAGETAVIHLEADPLPDGRTLAPADLAGISFRLGRATRAEFRWQGETLPAEPVPGTSDAVWIPLEPLRFPEPPAGLVA